MRANDQTTAVAVKICGLSTPDTVRAAVEHGASMVGFNFFEPSPRFVSFDRAAELARLVPAGVDTVAVTVDPDDAQIDAIVELGMDWIQLHGSEPPERALDIKRRTGLKVMKAIALETKADLERALAYEGSVDRLLFDAKAPPDSDIPGGNGLTIDWPLAGAYQGATPWMLSGGLEADNLEQAAGLSGATGLDVSSGVEVARGVKDVKKIAAFLKSAANLTAGAEISA